MSNFQRLWRNGAVRGGVAVLVVLALLGVHAPWLGTFDPSAMDPSFISVDAGTAGQVTLPDGNQIAHTFWMGSDSVGRDVWSRVLYGTRISMLVGLFTAFVAIAFGCAARACWPGYFRAVDAVLMRVMDGVDGHPGRAAGDHAGGGARRQPADRDPRDRGARGAARHAAGARAGDEPARRALRRGRARAGHATPPSCWRDILPNALAPLIVQGTFIAASAVLTEAILSFLGLGLPSDVPTWGTSWPRAGAVLAEPGQRAVPGALPGADGAGHQPAG